MANLTITEGMVLALLGKGLVYEVENCEMEYDMNIPLGIFGLVNENEVEEMTMHMTMKVEKCRFEIQKG